MASTDRAQNALLRPNASEINVPVGIPKIVAATTPNETNDTARPAFSGPVIFTAVSLASDQKTGRISAGTKRANAMTPMLGATAASRLEMAKNVSVATNGRFLGKPPNQAVKKRATSRHRESKQRD
ncbi:MAG TPA: hypothetical protein VIT21_12215 [Chthoniobacterales bacterium]